MKHQPERVEQKVLLWAGHTQRYMVGDLIIPTKVGDQTITGSQGYAGLPLLWRDFVFYRGKSECGRDWHFGASSYLNYIY